MGRRGMYDIIITFFLIATLLFAVLFFLYLNASSAVMYRKVVSASDAPRAAAEVKDALLACHRLEYLDERLMDAPCRADALFGGYRVRVHPLNGCEETVWDRTSAEGASIPFTVTVERTGGKRCLATLEVVVPEEGR